jgi:hypothetical protein
MVSDVKRELQAVLDSIKENDFHADFGAWENNGITIYIPKDTIFQDMTAKIMLNQHLFSDLVRDLSNNPLITVNTNFDFEPKGSK